MDVKENKILLPVLLFSVVLITGLTYAGTLNNFFLKDDAILINDGVRKGCSAVSLYYYETTDGARRCVLGIFYKAFGLSPSAFHVIALLIHLANTVLFFFFARGLMSFPGERFRSISAALVSLLFGVHYSIHEAVLWLSGIDELIMTFFLLGCVLMYKAYLGRGLKILYVFSVLFYIFASYSKVSAMFFPPVLVCLTVLYPPREKTFFRTTKLTAPYFLVAAFHVLMFHILSPDVPSRFFYSRLTSGYFFYNTFYYLSDYFLSLAGISRGPYLSGTFYLETYRRVSFAVSLLRSLTVLSLCVLILTMIAASLKTKKQQNGNPVNESSSRLALFGFLWMLITFFPFSCVAVVPLTDRFIEKNDLIHWRYLYLSCIGFCLMISGIMSGVYHKSILLKIMVCVFVFSVLLTNILNAHFVEKIYDIQGGHEEYIIKTIGHYYRNAPRHATVYLLGLPNGLSIHQASLPELAKLYYNMEVNILWENVPRSARDYCMLIKKQNASYFLQYTREGLLDITRALKEQCSKQGL